MMIANMLLDWMSVSAIQNLLLSYCTTTIASCLERAERNQELWAFAEVLRVKDRLLLSRNEPDPDQAEEYVVRSLDHARALRELSWELRAAMSLARLKRDEGRIEEGRDLLASVYGRFTEGFGTADLKAAKALIDDLQ